MLRKKPGRQAHRFYASKPLRFPQKDDELENACRAVTSGQSLQTLKQKALLVWNPTPTNGKAKMKGNESVN